MRLLEEWAVLTRSKVTNFPNTARIGMSNVMLLHNDKRRWSMLGSAFLV